MNGDGNRRAVIAVGGAALRNKYAGRAIGHTKRSRASRKADREHRRAARCYRWRHECAAETPREGTYNPHQLDICNLAVAEACLAYFENKKLLAVSCMERKQPPKDLVPFHGEPGGGLTASIPNDSGTTAAAEALALAGVAMGPWRVAVGGSAAAWAVGMVAVSFIRKVRLWCRRRRREAEENQRNTAAAATAAGGDGVNGADDIESGKHAPLSSVAIEVVAQQPLSPRLATDIPHNAIAVPVSGSLVEVPPAASMCGVVEDGMMGVSENNSSCGADFMKFELEDGELVEASSFIPVSIKGKTDVRPRKWNMEDLASAADGGCARVIGWGTFAKVAVTTLSNGVRIAVKAIERVMPETYFCQDDLIDGELKYLTMCAGHPGVVDCFGYLKTTLRVYVMMPLVPSNLEAILESLQGGSMNEDDTKGYMRQVGSALEYLHCKGVVHRDIKPANVLVTEDKTALLADFGVSTTIPEGETHLTELCGTKSYLSPEQLPEDPDDLAYGTEVDMWAFEVLAYEMLTGDTPFRPRWNGGGKNGGEETKYNGADALKQRQGIELTYKDTADAQERLNILNAGVSFCDGFGSKECIDFVSKLLQRNVSLRMPATKAAEHQWLGGLTEATAIRAKASTALEAHEQELKAERAKLMAGRRRVRVRTATTKTVSTAEEAGPKRHADAGEEEDARDKRQA